MCPSIHFLMRCLTCLPSLIRHAANREGAASIVWEGGSMMSSKGGGPKGPPLQQKKSSGDGVSLADRPPKPRVPPTDAGVSTKEVMV